VYALRVRLAAQILALPFVRYERIGKARLQALLTEDVLVVQQAMGTLPAISIGAMKAIACLLYLAWLSPLVTAVLVSAGGLLVLSQRMLQGRALRFSRNWFRTRDEAYRMYRGLIEGARELALNARRRATFFAAQIEPAIGRSQAASDDARRAHQWVSTWAQTSQFLIMLALFAVFSQARIEPGLAAAYAVVVFYASGAVTGALAAVPALIDAAAAVERIRALGFVPEQEARPPDPTVAAPVPADVPVAITLDALAFQYPPPASQAGAATEDVFALGPVSFSLHSGELVFLVGGNGSGKTTLMQLLVGLYAPTQGRILINGRAVDTDDLRESYRQLFSVVFADVFLFDQLHGLSQSVAASGLDALARDYLRKLHLEDKVTVRDGGLSSIDLSQGQRKRLALLTAYLEDRRVYVFDEWANSQDPEFRDIFYRELLPELKARGKLIVVISHDDQYYSVADRIIKLDLGQVVQDVHPLAPQTAQMLRPPIRTELQ
jgi:putative pyoverdin transport system ATP-binding/permease protein